MNSEVISDKHGIVLMTLFIMGSSLVIGTGSEAGKDSWLAILVAMLVSLPILMIYARILRLFPKRNFFDILSHVFGKFLGKGIGLIYIWFSFHLGALVLRNFGEFISNVSLNMTPIIIPMIFTIIICIWGVKCGIEVMGRWGELALLILTLFIILSLALLLPKMQLNNIRPILLKGVRPVFEGAFSVFSFPFAETVLFCLFFSSLQNSKSTYKVFSCGLLIGGIIVFITSLSEILVLGESEYTTLFFPSYNTVARINVFDFIQRSEIIVSISLLGGGFIKVCVCLLGACKGVEKVLDYKEYRFIVTPVALLMLNLAYLIYDNLMQMSKWAFTTWKYYAFMFQVILPIIIWIAAEIKLKQQIRKCN